MRKIDADITLSSQVKAEKKKIRTDKKTDQKAPEKSHKKEENALCFNRFEAIAKYSLANEYF